MTTSHIFGSIRFQQNDKNLKPYLIIKREMCDVDGAGAFEDSEWDPHDSPIKCDNSHGFTLLLQTCISTEKNRNRKCTSDSAITDKRVCGATSFTDYEETRFI